jgi:predicted dehydrogenase
MDEVRWGVLGCAQIAIEKVIPAMLKGKYSKISAIASRNIDKSKKVASNLGIPKYYGTYEELLLDKDIDAIYIPLPNHLHLEWCIKAMEAKKHVLCEKPIALTTTDIKTLIETRDRTGVKISEAFMVRSHPQWIKSKSLIDEGTIGELKAVHGFFSYFNDDPTNIRNIKKYGGGSIWDIGCYPINTSRFLFNEEPITVFATLKNDPNFNVDILSSAILEFPSGQAIFTSATQLAPFQRMTAFGTKKQLEVEIPFNAPIDSPTTLVLSDTISRSSEREILEIETCDQYTCQGDNFSLAILNNTEVPVTLEDSLNNTAVIEAIFRSSQSGKSENVDKNR